MKPNTTADMIKKMEDSIQHEAENKAKSIKTQAAQDADRFKTSTIYRAKLKLKDEKALRQKQIIAQKSVQLSLINGNQRMSILQIRDEAVHKAMDMAVKKLEEISKSSEYRDLLFKLCLQGLLSLLEPKVELAVKQADQELLEGMLDELSQEYSKRTEKEIEVSLSSYVVSDKCIGGVVLIAKEGQIQCSNTLADRLHLACKDLYPQINKIFNSK
ncbi:V-type proton ATPase subunit E [Histomonas meleagridis]|uniref:V-type proton ATPase subunit E n=1 Tax=Histomonas meleagridis TaxID=135588 RepID=UPI00355AB38A|nr:V-type proton ATPase subunit E [Histomonas meleagridis]KAH0797115.1 V-type proton ATPase subunit E [Histomonas meleagridis]